MLGACPSLLCSKSQSSIRHKVRKLRAKVRTLIPEHGCEHYQKRNNKISKFQHKRLLQCYTAGDSSSRVRSCEKFEANQIWRFGASKIQQWYVQSKAEAKAKANQRYQFHKLKQEEIDQINEDKIYYLGQKNIEAYNNFLKTIRPKAIEEKLLKSTQFLNENEESGEKVGRKTIFGNSKMNVNLSHNKSRGKLVYSSSFASRSTPAFNKLEPNEKPRKDSSTSISKFKFHSAKDLEIPEKKYESQHLLNVSQKIKPYQTFHAYKSLRTRKEEIEQEFKRRKLHQKVMIDIKMAKAQANQRQMNYLKYSKIKAIQDLENERHDRAIKKKNILVKRGEIVKVDEELRSIMIKRKNKKIHQRANSCNINQLVQSCKKQD